LICRRQETEIVVFLMGPDQRLQQIRSGPSKRWSGAKRRHDRDRPTEKRMAQRRAELLSRDAGGSAGKAT